jgi:hypothetical protein
MEKISHMYQSFFLKIRLDPTERHQSARSGHNPISINPRNIMKKTLLYSALLAALMSVAGGAQAVLVSQGTGLVLDNVNNLLWFTDSTNRNWDDATSWAAGLTTSGLSWNITTRDQFELLAAAAGSTVSEKNTTLLDLGIPSGEIWTSELQSPARTVQDRFFGSYELPAFYYVVTNASYAVGSDGWAGSNGELGSLAVASYASPAPEPETYALMLAGLGVVGFMARGRKAKAA